MRSLFALLGILTLTACKPASPPLGIGGQSLPVSDYSRTEVENLRAAISKLNFPVEEFTVDKLLPRPVKSVMVENVDWFPDRENKGRMGGNVREYWLNRDRVLKVATAYYKEGESATSREEWAVILTRAECERFSR